MKYIYRIVNKGKGLLNIDTSNLQKISRTNTSELTNDGENGTDPFITVSKSGQLEKITEGGNTGYALRGDDRTNKGNIGNNAVDLSVATEGIDKGATGEFSNAENLETTSSGDFSHAEGNTTISSGQASHAEGRETIASGDFGSHAEGFRTTASGDIGSHAEGRNTIASGNSSHAEGSDTIASGDESHAQGASTFARSQGEHSGGIYGTDYAPQNNTTDRLVNYGNGSDIFNPSDAWTLFKNGAHKFYSATLNTIQNTIKTGFVMLDETFRLNIHNGTEWKGVAFQEDVSTVSNTKLDKGSYQGNAQDLSDLISGVSSGYQGKLLISENPTQNGVYDPIENGTYVNAGNLTYLPDTTDKGFKVQFIKNNTTWTKNRIDLGIEEEVIPINKLKDVKTYGLPSDWVATSLAQFSYNSDIEAFESTRIFRVNIPKNTEGITAKYMAMIVSDDTQVLGFRTRNSSNVTIDEGSLLLKDDKKLYYVNIEDADVDHVDMYLANSYSRLYDFYIGDELPNFSIENFTITEPIAEKEPLWLAELNRDTVSAKGFKGQNIVIPVNRLTGESFKKYVFFEVEKSRTDLVLPIIFRIVNEFAQTVVSVTNEGRYGLVELTAQQQIDARGFLIIVSNNYEGGTDQDWVRIKNVRTSDSLSIQLVPELEIPKVQTSFEGKDLNYDEFYVGKTLFQGNAPDSVSRQIDINNENGYSNVSMYDYTGKSFSHKGVESVTVVDTKGTGVGRSLQTIDPSGMMFFSDANVSKKIQFEDFLNNLEPHDGKANNGTTDLNKDGITFINLPENASDSVKEAEYQRMKSEWKMLPQNVTLENYGDATVINPYQASRFSNGSLMSDKQLIRLGGETVIPNLNNPILGNPTHLLIYTTGDALLQEIPLGDHTTLNKGFLNVDQGSILYNDPVEAIIDWTNGKSIDVPVTLSAGTYKIAVRGRRYSTALVDGTIQVANDNGSSGSINMGAARSSEGQVIDESATITLTATTQITLTANCATTKPLELHNGGAETLTWGFTARGSFGTIVEYKTFPTRREGMAYFTRDNGESWDMLFDCSLNTIFTSTDNYHLHGACYDPYWKKLYIVAGDSEPDILPVLHCNFDQSTNLSTVEWKHSPQGISLYKANIGEQYCSVYAHKDYIFFGSDFTMTGLYRMPRIDKENLSHREPCFVINDIRITHVPTVFYQKNADEELFCLTIGATDQDMEFAPREYRTSLLHSTMDGVTWNEVWKDEIKIQGFGLNNYTKVFHYKDYVIMHVFKDFRFQNNHSIIILKYI